MTLPEIKQAVQGKWVSITPEVHPSAIKTPDGGIKPFYLTGAFTYTPDDRFELTILNLADPHGKAPLAKLFIKGHMFRQGDHAIAPGAQKVTFMADDEYEVTPLLQGSADAMNHATSKGFDTWEVHRTQSIFKKPFPPFGLVQDQVFTEYDLVYLHGDLLFWGARHVGGRGFDKEENRPANLQIPLVRKQL
jgi:hypothetical protein